MLKFKQTSNIRSDESASYSVEIQKSGVTLEEFVHHLITEYKGEWGYVKIQDKKCPWYSSTYEVEYRWGEIVNSNVPDSLKNKIIPQEIVGDGGWSRMDYIIKLEELK